MLYIRIGTYCLSSEQAEKINYLQFSLGQQDKHLKFGFLENALSSFNTFDGKTDTIATSDQDASSTKRGF